MKQKPRKVDYKRYFFAQDSSCHWFLVPEDIREEWDRWSNLDEDDEEAWNAPDGAFMLQCHISLWTFENPMRTLPSCATQSEGGTRASRTG